MNYELHELPIPAEALYSWSTAPTNPAIANDGTAYLDVRALGPSSWTSWLLDWPVNGGMRVVTLTGYVVRYNINASGDRYETRELTMNRSDGTFLVRGGRETEVPGVGWLFDDGTALYEEAKGSATFVRDRQGQLDKLEPPNERSRIRAVSAAGHLIYAEEDGAPWSVRALHIAFEWGKRWVTVSDIDPQRGGSNNSNHVNVQGTAKLDLYPGGSQLVRLTPDGSREVVAKLPTSYSFWRLNARDEMIGFLDDRRGPVVLTGGKVRPLMPAIRNAAGWSEIWPIDLNDEGVITARGRFGGLKRLIKLVPFVEPVRTEWAEMPDVRFEFTRTGVRVHLYNVNIRRPDGQVIVVPHIVIDPERPPVWGPEAILGATTWNGLLRELAKEQRMPEARALIEAFAGPAPIQAKAGKPKRAQKER